MTSHCAKDTFRMVLRRFVWVQFEVCVALDGNQTKSRSCPHTEPICDTWNNEYNQKKDAHGEKPSIVIRYTMLSDKWGLFIIEAVHVLFFVFGCVVQQFRVQDSV